MIESAAREWTLTVDAVDSALVVVDAGLRIRRLNLAASRLAGRPFLELVGRPFGELGGHQPWPAGRELLATGFGVGQAQAGTAEDSARGRRWELAVHLAKPGGEDPEAGPLPADRAVLVVRDTTRELLLRERLRRSELMSALGSLVAGVAHEVRNPLFGISAALDAFESRFGDRADQAQYFYVLRTQLARLNVLMQQLLDYGKPPKLAVAVEQFESLVAEAVASRGAMAERAGVEIETRFAPGLPALAMDRERLLQVLENLIDNALHHAPPASVVEVEVALAEAGEPGLLCRVLDRGPGFAAEDLERVFEPFFTRRSEGTGLGLALVQRIVEQHGGTVEAGNRAAGGGVVSVRLPREPAKPPEGCG